MLGFEPLPLAGDEVYESNGRLAHQGGEPGKIVERLLGRGVQNVVLREGGQPLRLGPSWGFGVDRIGTVCHCGTSGCLKGGISSTALRDCAGVYATRAQNDTNTAFMLLIYRTGAAV